MSIARDVFGVPILFSALENDDFYITFYRQCESRLKMVGALEALVGPESKVAIISKSFVSRDELYRVYGPIL